MSEDERTEQKPTVRITFSPPPLEPPIAMMVGRADREHIDAVRARSIQLAYARRHINRA